MSIRQKSTIVATANWNSCSNREIFDLKSRGFSAAGKYQGYVSYIHSSGEHLLESVNDPLDISTIEPGKKPLNKEMLMAGEIVTKNFNTLPKKAQENGIRLKTV
jgi:hypothetical protein